MEGRTHNTQAKTQRPKRRKGLIKRSNAVLFIPSCQKRFWGRVEKTETCWLWTSVLSRGYGQFSAAGIEILAHRYSYILAHGPVDDGLHIHHKCEVKRCVNPSHLEALTPAQHRKQHPYKPKQWVYEVVDEEKFQELFNA